MQHRYIVNQAVEKVLINCGKGDKMGNNKIKKSANQSNPSLMVVRGKKKTVKLKSSESIMDGNSIQMPFLAPYRGERISYVEYIWTTTEEGKQIKRGIKVSGHGKLGVPTLKEKEVLRALQDIYIWDKIEDGVLELETDMSKVKEEDLMIDFKTIDNIARKLGYKTIGGQKRKDIKDSIEILVATTLINSESGGLYDPITKKYITNSTETFRYLDKMKDYTTYDCDNCLFFGACGGDYKNCMDEANKRTDITRIKMSEFMYSNIANNYRLYYERNEANQIKNLIAKNIYMISRKWLGNGYISRANIQRYLDRIPMNAKKEKHRKQSIKEAIHILNSYSFVNAWIEEDTVVVEHLDKKEFKNNILSVDKLPTNDTTYLKHRFNSFSDFRKGLDEIKLTEEDFNAIIDINMEKIEYFKALLRYVMLKSHYDDNLDTRQYFINCYKANRDIDKKYYSSLD